MVKNIFKKIEDYYGSLGAYDKKSFKDSVRMFSFFFIMMMVVLIGSLMLVFFPKVFITLGLVSFFIVGFFSLAILFIIEKAEEQNE